MADGTWLLRWAIVIILAAGMAVIALRNGVS
jgi:hypothetical protein